MIRTQIFRDRLPPNRSIEHPTECPAIDDPSMNTESDNPSSVLIQDDQHPIRTQCDGFTSEEIDAVKAVFCVTDEGEPGSSATICRGIVVGGKNPADDILIDTYSEGQRDLLGNTRTSPCVIAPLHLDNGTNQLPVRAFSSGFRSAFG